MLLRVFFCAILLKGTIAEAIASGLLYKPNNVVGKDLGYNQIKGGIAPVWAE